MTAIVALGKALAVIWGLPARHPRRPDDPGRVLVLRRPARRRRYGAHLCHVLRRRLRGHRRSGDPMSKYAGRVSKRERNFRAACFVAYLAAYFAAVAWLLHWLGIL
jgi:hypothetical protein